MNTETKNCANCKKDFVIEARDFAFYEHIQVPPPTWCPKCRAIRRMVFWNQSNLFRKTEKRTGQVIFSTYPEEADLEIYEHDYWWSDAWDQYAYGRELDFAKPFLEQVRELIKTVPWPSKAVRGMVDSDYCNQASFQKNCYLCFNGGSSENCLYCVGFDKLSDSVDMSNVVGAELCYDVHQAGLCSQCFFCRDIENSRNLRFCRDCTDCSDCYGSTNLKSKKYHIWNQPYSKEEYEAKLKELDPGSYSKAQEALRRVSEAYLAVPHKHMYGSHNENVTGEYVYYSKNSFHCYEAGGLENVSYSESLANGIKDSYDYTNWGHTVELMYENISVGDKCRNVKFSFDSWPAMTDSEYCMNCHSSSNLFGCVGLKKAQYCILNKQYTKEEYERLVPMIKKHMREMPYIDARGRAYAYGEFFPPEFTPFAYNETSAQEFYPKTKEEAVREGFSWREPPSREFRTTIKAEDLPDHIRDAKEDVLKEIIQCLSCRKAYRILDRELAFYKRFSIPLPRLCHTCRYARRLALRNPRETYERACDCKGAEGKSYKNTTSHFHGEGPCPGVFETSYAPGRPEIVYCASCYNSEVG